MFLPLVFITLLISQDSLTANMQYYPVLKMVPEYEESPFRGEPYIFEVTQPFIKLDERSLLSLNVTNKRSLPLPPNFTFWSFIRNIPFRETAGFPPYLVKNLYITLKPPAVSMLDRHKFPVWVSLKDFIGNIPFSQIRLFKKKSESENMQFTFGRNISDFGRFNIAADYIDSTQKTKRSMVLSSNIKLPFNTSSHFIFLDISNDFSYYSFEDKYLFFSVDRKEGNIGIVKKTAGGKDLLGITSNMFFHMPYQRFTIGFDYPDLLSSFYQFIFVDQINLFPLSYIVPRFAIDADRHYTVSLGTGYHPLLNLYVYSNIQKESDKTLYYSFGLRKRMRKAYLEGFVYSQGQEPIDSSGVVFSYTGKILSGLYLSSILEGKAKGKSFVFLQPSYERSFKKGKLTPGIFFALLYPKSETLSMVQFNIGTVVRIVDVSFYFVFDDANSYEERSYRFGVQWNFYD